MISFTSQRDEQVRDIFKSKTCSLPFFTRISIDYLSQRHNLKLPPKSSECRNTET